MVPLLNAISSSRKSEELNLKDIDVFYTSTIDPLFNRVYVGTFLGLSHTDTSTTKLTG